MGGGGLTELETHVYKAKYFTKIHKIKRQQEQTLETQGGLYYGRGRVG